MQFQLNKRDIGIYVVIVIYLCILGMLFINYRKTKTAKQSYNKGIRDANEEHAFFVMEQVGKIAKLQSELLIEKTRMANVVQKTPKKTVKKASKKVV